MKKITVNGNLLDWEENITINEIIKKMNYSSKMFIVKVNGELIRNFEYGTKVVPKNAKINFINLVSGG